MAIARKCDMCGKIDTIWDMPNATGMEWGKYIEQSPHCFKCSEIIERHEMNARNQMLAQCETATKSLNVLSLLQYLATEKPDRFRECFGSEAERQLKEACQELSDAALAAVKL